MPLTVDPFDLLQRPIENGRIGSIPFKKSNFRSDGGFEHERNMKKGRLFRHLRNHSFSSSQCSLFNIALLIAMTNAHMQNKLLKKKSIASVIMKTACESKVKPGPWREKKMIYILPAAGQKKRVKKLIRWLS